jgi:hypothetical protein
MAHGPWPIGHGDHRGCDAPSSTSRLPWSLYPGEKPNWKKSPGELAAHPPHRSAWRGGLRVTRPRSRGADREWTRARMRHHAMQPRSGKTTGVHWTFGVKANVWANDRAIWDKGYGGRGRERHIACRVHGDNVLVMPVGDRESHSANTNIPSEIPNPRATPNNTGAGYPSIALCQIPAAGGEWQIRAGRGEGRACHRSMTEDGGGVGRGGWRGYACRLNSLGRSLFSQA